MPTVLIPPYSSEYFGGYFGTLEFQAIRYLVLNYQLDYNEFNDFGTVYLVCNTRNI